MVQEDVTLLDTPYQFESDDGASPPGVVVGYDGPPTADPVDIEITDGGFVRIVKGISEIEEKCATTPSSIP